MTNDTQKKTVKLLYDIYTLNIGINQRIEEIFKEMQNEKKDTNQQEPVKQESEQSKQPDSLSNKFKSLLKMFKPSKSNPEKQEVTDVPTEQMVQEVINIGYNEYAGTAIKLRGGFPVEYTGEFLREPTDITSEQPVDKPTPDTVWCGVCRKHHEKDADGRVKHEPF